MLFIRIAFLTLLSLAGSSFVLQAQNDSIPYTGAAMIKEGLFLSYEDFRHNKSIPKTDIQSPIKKEQLDFLTKVTEQDSIVFVAGGAKVKTATKKIWGFYQNNTLFVNYENNFYRVPVFGAICYLVATVETYYNNGFYDPFFNNSMGVGTTTPTKEIRDFLMDFQDGKVIPFSMEKVESLLQKNKSVYDEFMKLKKRQRKEQVSRYIRKFNEAQTIYFLR
jgi:hypothetical protein